MAKKFFDFLSEDLRFANVEVGNTAHLKKVASKFFYRTKLYRQLSFLLLLLAVLFTIVGVVVFLVPSTFADLGDRTSLLNRLDDLIDERASLLSQSADVNSEQEKLRLIIHALLDFDELNKTLEGNDDDLIKEWAVGSEIDRLILRAIRVSSALGGDEPVSIQLDHTYSPYATVHSGTIELIPGYLFKEIRDLYKIEKAGSLDLKESLLTIRKQMAASKEDEIVREARLLADQLTPFIGAYNEALEDFQKLRMRQSNITLEGKELQENLKAVDEKINIIQSSVLEGSNSDSFWQSWTSMFTIRVCVVVLLLFMTQILLSTYRYLMSVGAYYAARGDALQLVSEDNQSGTIDIEKFSKLLAIISPDDHTIDKTEGPDDKLIAALTSAMDKIPSAS